jgi:hypothetical protein
VFTLNQARAERLHESRFKLADAAGLNTYQERVQQAAMTRSGYKPVSGAVPVTSYGTIQREGYRIEKLTYESEPGIFIPSLLFIPAPDPRENPRFSLPKARGSPRQQRILANSRMRVSSCSPSICAAWAKRG